MAGKGQAAVLAQAMMQAHPAQQVGKGKTKGKMPPKPHPMVQAMMGGGKGC